MTKTRMSEEEKQTQVFTAEAGDSAFFLCVSVLASVGSAVEDKRYKRKQSGGRCPKEKNSE